MTPASAARAYNRVHSVRALDHIAGEIPNAKPVAKVGNPADDMYGKGFHPELPNYDSDIPVNHLPPPPNPATSTPATTPSPSTTSPAQTNPAPTAGPSPVNTGTPAPQDKTLPIIPGLPGFDPEAAAVLSDASTPGGLPAPLAAVQMSQLQPGESTQFGGATITATPEGGYSANAVDPTTGAVDTTVWNAHSSVVLRSQSTPVPGTDGNSWETIITHADGSVSEVFSVAGPDGVTTFTANPDGSHSVQYPNGTIINEPPPGSTLPVIVTQLGPDGRSGHTVAYFPDGRVVESGFRPSEVFGTPVTDVFGSDGEHVNVLTVPGRDSGAPFSIVSGDDGNRTVVGPDNSVTAIDRYNNAIGGSGNESHFDPLAGAWTTDKISHRGPISYAPDGTATQPWYYAGPGGELRTAIAQFDRNNQLTMLTDSDYKGMKWSAFETIDGVSVPTQSGVLDAGNVEDNAILVFELATLIADLPFAAAGWGARIGTRWYGSQLAGHGSSLAARQLAVSQLSTRALTGLTTGVSVSALERLRAAIAARSTKADDIAPGTPAVLPTQAKPIPTQTIAIPGASSAAPARSASGSGLPASQTGVLGPAYQRPGAGLPLNRVLTSETAVARAAENLVAEIKYFVSLQVESPALVSAGARTPAVRQALQNNATNAGTKPGGSATVYTQATPKAMPQAHGGAAGSAKSGSSGTGGHPHPNLANVPPFWSDNQTWTHIFKGELKKAFYAKGYHHRPGGRDRYGVKVTDRTTPNRDGVYQGRVHMSRWVGGEWVTKVGWSTFFPDTWSSAQVRRAVESAMKNATHEVGNLWVGVYRGIKIGGFIDIDTGRIITAFPILKKHT
ncbi:EndoU domain-containing protein [Nocardia ignorata]|uniref:EndoU domain-containing protein n=1 Tax=Nocardia ignorata TaxID=145285 RepID=UPI0036262480